MNTEEKAKLIYILTETDEPEKFDSEKWTEIETEGKKDADENKPILLALAKCKYTPKEQYLSTISSVPMELRHHYLASERDDLSDSERYEILDKLIKDYKIQILENRGEEVGKYNISDGFMSAILKRGSYHCIDLQSAPYSAVSDRDKLSYEFINSDKFLDEVYVFEDITTKLASNTQLNNEYRDRVFDIGCNIYEIKSPTIKMQNEIYDMLAMRIFDFSDSIKTAKDKKEYNKILYELNKRLQNGEISVRGQMNILDHMKDRPTIYGYRGILENLLEYTTSDTVLATAYYMIHNNFGMVDRARLYHIIDNNIHLSKQTMNAIVNHPYLPIPVNIHELLITASKNGGIYEKDLRKLFEEGHLKGVEKEAAIIYIANMCSTTKDDTNGDIKFLKEYGKKYDIKEIGYAIDILNIAFGQDVGNFSNKAMSKMLEAKNTADEILESTDKNIKRKKVEMLLEFNRPSTKIKDSFYIIGPIVCEHMEETYKRAVEQHPEIKSLAPDFLNILEQTKKRSNFFVRYKPLFLDSTKHSKRVYLDDIRVNLKRLYDFFKTPNNPLVKQNIFIQKFSELDEQMREIIIMEFNRAYNEMALKECDLREKFDYFCPDIVSYFKEQEKEIITKRLNDTVEISF